MLVHISIGTQDGNWKWYASFSCSLISCTIVFSRLVLVTERKTKNQNLGYSKEAISRLNARNKSLELAIIFRNCGRVAGSRISDISVGRVEV